MHWPRTWLDLTTPTPVAALVGGTVAVVDGTLSDLQFDPPIAKRRARVTGVVTDAAGDSLPVVWHNQSFLRRALANGQHWLFVGPLRWSFQDKAWILSNPARATEPAVLPVYPETEGISSAFLRGLVGAVLPVCTLPSAVDDAGADPALSTVAAAIEAVHRPVSVAAARQAKQRLALDELACLQFELIREHERSGDSVAVPIVPDLAGVKTLVGRLPFPLTADQRRSGWAIMRQFESAVPQRHLLQGDVGTGKTVVGLLAAYSALVAGRPVFWMAPTQLLARQLKDRLEALLVGTGIPVELVLGQSHANAPDGGVLFVGTQALLGLKVQPALVVVDEQHRFGVAQQQALLGSGAHLLAMSATPIPRALLLALYDQQTCSQLRIRPAMQQPVRTRLISEMERAAAVQALREAVGRGEQGFVIVPRIEGASDGTDTGPTLVEILATYEAALPSVRIAAYHGQLPRADQERIMEAFVGHSIDILVATSVVEVGLDVPNATVMVIEQAAWFGLAQLHQLRGRIGRGSGAGTCIVLAAADDPNDRLNAFCASSDGFELAAIDLKLRGPGDLLGELQAGWGRMKLADVTDLPMIIRSRVIAQEIVRARPASLEAWRSAYRYITGEDDDAA